MPSLSKLKNKKANETFLSEEVSPIYLEQKANVEELLLIAKSQIAAGDLSGATSTLSRN